MKKIIIQNLRVALILFAIQFFMAVLFSYKYFSLQTILGIVILAGITSVAFILCIVIYQIIYIKTHKISLNDFSIQAKQEATFTINKSEADTIRIMENNIPDEINAYQFKYNKKLHFYTTKTGATLRSWGETILVKLNRIDPEHTQLYVLSKPVYKLTLVDFGKSAINIEKFKSAFK